MIALAPADIANGAFELTGGFLIINHCRAVLRDKAVAGVSILSTAIFTSWGFWNLFYYPHLDQWASFAGGLLIVSANCWWVYLMVKYKHGWANVFRRYRDGNSPAADFRADRSGAVMKRNRLIVLKGGRK